MQEEKKIEDCPCPESKTEVNTDNGMPSVIIVACDECPFSPTEDVPKTL